MFLKKFVFSTAIISLLGIFVIGGNFLWNEYQVKKSEEKRQALYDRILDGASIQPTTITIDYNRTHSKGSPLVFGGAQYPNSHEEEVWNLLEEVGVTAMRTDFYVENMVPYNSSVEDYKNNVNNIQDPLTWRTDFIQTRRDAYSNARERGMAAMGIMSYAPGWLTHSQTTRGVPMDWNVYEDIVRKSYLIHRDSIDYLELWNEPTFADVFLHVENSGLTPKEAFVEIFYHAARAVRQVDTEKNDGKKVMLGGPASDNPYDASMLDALLKDERTRGHLDFISYHNYHMNEPSWDNHKAVLKKYNMEHLPIFITEWNYKAEDEKDDPYKTSYPAILFTANKLLDFLKMGIAGANYYALLQVEPVGTDKRSHFLSFYRVENGTVELLPQARTWRLLSKNLGLGKGESKISLPQEKSEDLNVIGFTNASQQQGLAIVNASPSANTVTLHLKNINKDEYIKLSIYQASAENDAMIPVYEGLVKAERKSVNLALSIPKESVMGIVLDYDKQWYNPFTW